MSLADLNSLAFLTTIPMLAVSTVLQVRMVAFIVSSLKLNPMSVLGLHNSDIHPYLLHYEIAMQYYHEKQLIKFFV